MILKGDELVHQAFYRKWRPQTFDDVCGQEHITSVLRYEVEHGAFSHAYLFCGSRGTGKTTCAKILAKAVNCENPVGGSPCGVCVSCQAIDSGAATDVLEMDAASNNGVDNIRDIRDEVVYAPSSLKKRVYIIDEVHMLSLSAFNALLKTLEEPPEHVVFILATTDLQKLPATIISRCQRFDFRRITTDVLTSRLQYIAEREQLSLDPEAARMLAKLAQGGMRDAISLLELCSGSSREITVQTVIETVGITGRDSMINTVLAIVNRDYETIFAQIDEVVQSSKDLVVFWQNLISFYRDLLVVKATANAARYLDLTDSETEQITSVAAKFKRETLLYHCKLLEDALFAMKKANEVKRVVAELTLVRMCDETLDESNEALLSRIAKLEDSVAIGAFQAKESPKAEKTVESTKKSEDPPQKEQSPKSADPLPRKAAAEASAKRILRPLQNWVETIERLATTDAMSASFWRSASAFTTDAGQILVRFTSDFALNMAKANGGSDKLRGALSVVLRREIPESALLLEVKTANQASVLDEIIEAASEQSI